MGGMLPAQPQHQMGVAAMGMYPGVMPYGMMPGMHPQVTLSLLKCLNEDISEVKTRIYICCLFAGSTRIAHAQAASITCFCLIVTAWIQ